MTENEILAVENPAAQEEPLAGDQIAGEDPSISQEELQQIQVEVTFPERPFMTTPLDDYTVSEGLLLMIWLTVIVLAVLKIVKEAFEWLFW